MQRLSDRRDLDAKEAIVNVEPAIEGEIPIAGWRNCLIANALSVIPLWNTTTIFPFLSRRWIKVVIKTHQILNKACERVTLMLQKNPTPEIGIRTPLHMVALGYKTPDQFTTTWFGKTASKRPDR